jgi:hypothetical protein
MAWKIHLLSFSISHIIGEYPLAEIVRKEDSNGFFRALNNLSIAIIHLDGLVFTKV